MNFFSFFFDVKEFLMVICVYCICLLVRWFFFKLDNNYFLKLKYMNMYIVLGTINFNLL